MKTCSRKRGRAVCHYLGQKNSFCFSFIYTYHLSHITITKFFFNPKSRWTIYREIYLIQLIKASHSLKFQKNVIFKRYKLWKVLDQNSGADVKGCLEEREQSVPVCPECLAECVIHISQDWTWCAVDATRGWSSMLRIWQFGQDDRAQQ